MEKGLTRLNALATVRGSNGATHRYFMHCITDTSLHHHCPPPITFHMLFSVGGQSLLGILCCATDGCLIHSRLSTLDQRLPDDYTCRLTPFGLEGGAIRKCRLETFWSRDSRRALRHRHSCSLTVTCNRTRSSSSSSQEGEERAGLRC